MPTLLKSLQIFTNQDTRTWVQSSGIGTAFVLYTCQAITEWSRDFSDPVFIKCKSVNQYDRHVTKRTVAGEPQEPTFSVSAWSPEDEEFLTELECPVDWQIFYGSCESPSSPTGYSKIRHFHRSFKTNDSESGVDYIGQEDAAGIEQGADFQAEEMVVIFQVAATANGNGVTETQGFNDIAMLANGRCEGDCGPEISDCEWGAAGADASYGIATANVWQTQDGGDNWEVMATDPFGGVDGASANVSAIVILSGETAPRIIVFRGNVSGWYAARASITDDWGVTWTEVDMGGNLNGSYVNSAFAFNDGLIYAVGNNGSIWYSSDRAASWTWLPTGTTGVAVDLYDIHTIDADTVYAVGASNTIIKSTDGTDTWETLAGPADGTETLWTVQSPTIWRVLVGGEIDASEECLWVSTDGGDSWTNIAFEGSTTAAARVRRLRMAPRVGSQHMVMIHGTGAANDRFLRTLDGGGTWERMTAVTNAGLNGLSVCDINTAFAAGEPSGGVAIIQKMSVA